MVTESPVKIGPPWVSRQTHLREVCVIIFQLFPAALGLGFRKHLPFWEITLASLEPWSGGICSWMENGGESPWRSRSWFSGISCVLSMMMLLARMMTECGWKDTQYSRYWRLWWRAVYGECEVAVGRLSSWWKSSCKLWTFVVYL